MKTHHQLENIYFLMTQQKLVGQSHHIIEA